MAAPVDRDPGRALDFDLSVRIAAPPANVFAMLADVQEHVDTRRGAGGVKMAKSPDGATAPGTRWHEEVRLLPGVWMRVDSVARIVEAPYRLVEDFRSSWFRGQLAYTVEPADGGTLLRQRESLRLRDPLCLTAQIVDRMLRPRLLERLANIRDMVEATPRAGKPPERGVRR